MNGVLDRFSQVDPVILISTNAVVYNGKVHDHIAKLKQVIAGMFGVLFPPQDSIAAMAVIVDR